MFALISSPRLSRLLHQLLLFVLACTLVLFGLVSAADAQQESECEYDESIAGECTPDDDDSGDSDDDDEDSDSDDGDDSEDGDSRVDRGDRGTRGGVDTDGDGDIDEDDEAIVADEEDASDDADDADDATSDAVDQSDEPNGAGDNEDLTDPTQGGLLFDSTPEPAPNNVGLIGSIAALSGLGGAFFLAGRRSRRSPLDLSDS